MAYDNGKQGYVWLGKSYPSIQTTEAYCDGCAQAGAILFDVRPCRECGGEGSKTAPFVCLDCGVPVAYHQERPWRWGPIGWDSEIDKRACDKCGEPCASGRPFWATEKTE